ncbi:hypothetical protein RBU49_00930 [Clostridium sp. MB40-C1]|uniref:hypothetical protein n=1 Tax=Clostridium sp. MB40-C1 TaxID=3070996 RepID=UPI0027E1C72E|nr:hypothetical protein [Clostridium sp. MB40-C1]WMJ80842.1 hypothetical protein RBU49_00930 [Clostridium sp. MB40-C1]
MKLSNREKILSIIFLVVILLLGIYKFLLSPRYHKISELKKSVNKNYEEIEKLKSNAVNEKKINKDIAIINAKIYGSIVELFPSIKEEKIIVILNDMIEKAGIECNSITISKPEVIKFKEESKKNNSTKFILKDIVDEYSKIDTKEESKDTPLNNKKDNKVNEKDKNNKTKNLDIEAEKMIINTNFKGTFTNVMDFIDNITEYDKRIIIKSISVTADGDKLAGNLTLQFYSVPKFSIEGDGEYLKWDFKNQYGKTNPFFDNGISKPNNNTDKNEKTSKQRLSNKEYDFGVNVVPISSDLPTTIMGKMGESSKKSYIISDSPGIENIEIYFTKKDGKYYYKYKNSREYYPGNFNGVGEEFQAAEDTINISVLSCNRNSTEDNTGANLKVYNDTDKEVVVDIKYDDNKKNRISVFKESGKVTVNRK